jgi:acetate kinase
MASNLLVFNCGSSSLTYKLYRADAGAALAVLASGKAHHIGMVTQEAAYLRHAFGAETLTDVRPLPDHRTAAAAVLAQLRNNGAAIDAIGHRFVHGGPHFQAPTVITDDVVLGLEACNRLAPIHTPSSLSAVHLCRAELPQVMQYAVFDTAFHATLPEAAYRCALPLALADRHGFRKFGFHGLSYEYVTHEAARVLDRPIAALKIIACHLGTGGSSVAAIAGGRSVETSMGYTPLPGLMMSTRSGDLDPSVVLALIAEHGYTADAVDRLLNRESGLIGVSGASSDLLELIRLADEAGDQRVQLAVAMYVHRLRSYIGAYAAVLGGFDALVFTDDIGVRGWQVRARACADMAWCGVILDAAANRRAPTDAVAAVSAAESRVTVLSIPTDEEVVVARAGLGLLAQ